MKPAADPVEQRQILATARQYRRNGYRLTIPERGHPLPSFLDGLVPDLIAERDDDHVIIEIKRANTVAGSNDIVALAEKVALQQHWRFELISVPAARRIILPAMAAISNDVDRLSDLGFMTPAFLVCFAMLENLVAYAAAKHNVNPANRVFAKLTRELAVLGVISRETRRLLEDASERRNDLTHAIDGSAPTRTELDALLELVSRIEVEVREQEAA